jgi:SAM-dependent methyltransferase
MAMLRWFRWHLAKRRLADPFWINPSPHVRIFHQFHQARPEEFPPNAEGYQRLASVWNDYGDVSVPRYGPFLASAGDFYGLPIQAVLDLACGTGLLTRRIGKRAGSVVGLDASEAMLGEARSRTRADNVRYLRGDFRDFSLDETFDAVVCGGDSLNYLETPEEMVQVCRCVHRHLRPGGFFVFDVKNQQSFRAMARLKTAAEVRGEQFEVYYFYDSDRRVCEARVVFPGTVERHRRVPIEDGDVRRAAAEAGLMVAEHFPRKPWLFPAVGFSLVRRFYVLRKL